jgi:hypothetical protein
MPSSLVDELGYFVEPTPETLSSCEPVKSLHGGVLMV